MSYDAPHHCDDETAAPNNRITSSGPDVLGLRASARRNTQGTVTFDTFGVTR